MRNARSQFCMILQNSEWYCTKPVSKVIIEKSRGEVSLVEQDTIENVSEPIKK